MQPRHHRRRDPPAEPWTRSVAVLALSAFRRGRGWVAVSGFPMAGDGAGPAIVVCGIVDFSDMTGFPVRPPTTSCPWDRFAPLAGIEAPRSTFLHRMGSTIPTIEVLTRAKERHAELRRSVSLHDPADRIVSHADIDRRPLRVRRHGGAPLRYRPALGTSSQQQHDGSRRLGHHTPRKHCAGRRPAEHLRSESGLSPDLTDLPEREPLSRPSRLPNSEAAAGRQDRRTRLNRHVSPDSSPRPLSEVRSRSRGAPPGLILVSENRQETSSPVFQLPVKWLYSRTWKPHHQRFHQTRPKA